MDRAGVDSAQVGGIRLRYRWAGDGPLLVLLHGWPQTSYCWRWVMPMLARHYTVVAPDMRGYGGSDKPPGGYDKRTLAADMSVLIRALGFDRADVVGHDRGARVAHRWALDRPDDIRRLALLDILPTPEVMRGIDMDSASMLWHWFFHRQPDLPELLVAGNERAYLSHFLLQQCYDPAAFDEEAISEYVRAYQAPGAMHASFEEYRSAFTVDLEHDERDAANGRLLRHPLLVLWGADGGLGGVPVLDVWRRYAHDLRGEAIPDCRHYLPEERPAATAALLGAFFSRA